MPREIDTICERTKGGVKVLIQWYLESDPPHPKNAGILACFITESSWKIRALLISIVGIYIWLKEIISILKLISWVSGDSEINL